MEDKTSTHLIIKLLQKWKDIRKEKNSGRETSLTIIERFLRADLITDTQYLKKMYEVMQKRKIGNNCYGNKYWIRSPLQ